VPARVKQVEPEQQAERRLVLRKPGTTAYWKASFHAPSFVDESFFPLLVADAVLNGAGGLNIWSGGGVPRPQRSARLYRALVDKGLTSSVNGSMMPTQHPFLYGISASVAEGQSLSSVDEVVLAEIDRLCKDGITPDELKKVHAQLRARFVYDGDSVTDIAHQLGYFETIATWQGYHALGERLNAVTAEQVQAAAVKYLIPSNRTIGWFEPCR
jgi:zinc protease